MSAPEKAAPEPPPVTDPEVAAALAGVAELDAEPLAEHHDRLAAAHAVLDRVLHREPTEG